ncbi:porin [Paludibacterium sp. B53371]|uniref:porin n=1 Tax=Paludibacterium sp. B53371 TaxID=2806263 RepID=UPI001C05C83F|nr:porin [Paludibacterium sp. B53371]
MHLRWIPLLACPLSAPLWADVTLYGELHGSLGRHTLSRGPNQNRLDNAGTHFGIKGSESLGNGLKTLWQIELEAELDGSKAPSPGQTFAGLSDASLGTLRLGHLNSALKGLYTVNQWRSGGSIAHHRHQGHEGMRNFGADALKVFTNPGKRLKNAIAYDSPVVAGFQTSLSYGFGENATRDSTGQAEIERPSDIFSLGLSYAAQGWFAAYAFQREANPCSLRRTGDKKECRPQAGGELEPAHLHYFEAGYRNDQWLLALAWQQARGYDWTDGFSGDSQHPQGTTGGMKSAAESRLQTRQAALSLAHTRGAITAKLTLAHGWDQRTNGERLPQTGYRQWIIGADYQLSKRTQAGIAHGRLIFAPQAGAAVAARATTLTSTSLSLSHKF